MKKLTFGSDKKVSNRKYMLGENWAKGMDKVNGVTTPQARKCLEFVELALKMSKKDRVTEPELKEFVKHRGAELKTKQEPWHIFMYYRPALIEAKILKYAPEEAPAPVEVKK